MPTKCDFDIFISHATQDHALAEALRTLFCRALGLDESRVFVSSDDTSMALARRVDEQIAEAHQSARIVVALMTPQSIFRPWVISETGGASFQSGKPLLIVLANGVTPACLPAPMRAWFACSLNEASGRQKLCEKLAEALGKDCAKLDQNAEERLASLAVSVGGDWKTVQQVLLAKLAADSPFGLRYMLDDKAAQGAKRRIYLFGQNVHIVTCGEAALAFKQMIFDWLSREPERKFSIVITGLDCANGVATLEDIFPGFRGQLEVSTQALREWVSEAKDRNLNFQVHVTPFVPMTATFVDPTDDNGYMVLTPITFKPSPTERPHFIISKGENEDVLNYYWHDFYQRLRAQSKLLV